MNCPTCGDTPMHHPLRAVLRQHDVERFYYDEAALLDGRQYTEWLRLFSADVHYFMPLRRTRLTAEIDKEFTRPGEMAYFDDTKELLAGRIARLLTGRAWGEDPPSRTRHSITNVRVLGDDGNTLDVEASFHVYRARLKQDVDSWIGRRIDVLRRVDGSFQIVRRRILLDQTVLLSPSITTFF